MLLGDPPRTGGDLHFSLFGIPVRVHPFFWVVALLLGMRSNDVISLLVWVVAVFLGIVVHEMGHALVMRSYGFSPWITLYGLGGMASYNQAQMYGPQERSAQRQITIAAAGPIAGFLFAAAVAMLLTLAGYSLATQLGAPYGILLIPQEQIGSPALTRFVFDLMFISITWGLVNLLPVFPLDGGQIAREILQSFNPAGGLRQSLILSMVVAGAMAVVGVFVWQSLFVGLLFGFMAYSSYQTLQQVGGYGPRW